MPLRVPAVVAILLAAVLVPAAAAAPRTTLQQRLAGALAASPGVSGATVLDLDTGATVFSHDPNLSLVPASNEKLAVTYAALTALGGGYRIETDAESDGAQDGNVWHGDLYLVGHGDPSLSKRGLASLARQIRADGIRRIDGRILGDESWFDAERTVLGWKPSFYLVESPPLSALIVNRGWTGHATTTQPALEATQLFRAALVAAGVAVSGGSGLGVAPDDSLPLAELESPSIATLVRFMDRQSDNFTAEMLLKQLGAVAGSGGTTADGVGVVTGILQQAAVPLRGVRLVDGSGLSLLDRWTPAALADLLRTMWLDPSVHDELLASLPVAAQTGTLAHRMLHTAAAGVVHAKTGTTDRSSALSGFVGDRYVFSVVENGFPVSWTLARRAQDRFANVLASVAH
ncbi:MAG TPA: D-alanyl-D-alanine carboxypeptidase [Gaiellaceae bacterium]|nr:D-alanyl-D-alanine carboxypeptidase [Gaiellaceae bacterium]